MQTYLSRALLLALLASGPAASAATLFQDGFEQGLDAWTMGTTNQGRVTASTEHVPASGTSHLVLDDAVNDSTASVAEATVTLDLSDKKNVVLQFKAKSLGNEAHAPPAENFTSARSYDGVAISTDGGVIWRSVQSLAATGTAWTSYSVPLDAAIAQLGGTFGPGCRIRFSAYDNAPAPFDGIAIDDVSISADPDQRVVIELPGPVTEGGGPYTGYVQLHYAPEAPLTVNLFASTGTVAPLIVPASVTVPAGVSSVSFQYTPENDQVITLHRSGTIYAFAEGLPATSGTVLVLDDEVPVVSLALPATLKEGETPSNNATLSFEPAPAVGVSLSLAGNPAGELTLPSFVSIPAGQTQVTFTVRANNDTKEDGDIPVVVTASAAGVTFASTTATALDNDSSLITLTLPTYVTEGSSGSASVALGSSRPEPVVVSLSLQNGTGLTLPGSVTIAAGATSANFTIAAADNSDRDGTRTSPLQASAAGFTTATKDLVVRDNDIGSYVLSEFTDIMPLGTPVTLKVLPADIEGRVIGSSGGTVNLELVLPDGSTLPTTPAAVTYSSSGWTNAFTMPPVDATGLRLRARDAGGYTGISVPFDAMRSLAMKAADLVWDPVRQRIYASVAASDTGIYKNTVVAIDPVTMQVTGTAATGQDPRRMVLTPDGQYLYVSLFTNGTIAKINPATMGIVSSFAVGTSWNGILYAGDMCAVAGQPESLIVSRLSKSSGNPDGAAVYDSGVPRPVIVNSYNTEIEPTADATIYLGYNNHNTGHDFNKLVLQADGLSVLATRDGAIDEFVQNFQTQGNTLFASNGEVIDASTLHSSGTFSPAYYTSDDEYSPDVFNNQTHMRAELAENRVYFIDGTYVNLFCFDAATHARVRQVDLPPLAANIGSFIRWGDQGLAFRNDNMVRLLSTTAVASKAPANLQTTVQATPDPAVPGAFVTYSVQVTNHGPNPAPATRVTATLTSDQTLNTATASTGTTSVSEDTITLACGDLAAGASVTLTLTATPDVAGIVNCQALAESNAVDPDGSNSADIAFVRVGYQTGPDKINTLNLIAESIIYDKTRSLLWAAIPSRQGVPLSKSVVSIDPASGAISKPIPLGANPKENLIALSGNGRYLYVALSEIPYLCRVDLEASPPAVVKVPLVVNEEGDHGFAEDLEVLEGDGKSVLVSVHGSYENTVVIDDLTPRPMGNVRHRTDRIAPTATPDVFIGLNSQGFSENGLSRLQVTPQGLTPLSYSPLFFGAPQHVLADGDLLFTTNARLVNSTTLNLEMSWEGKYATPCLDRAHDRAYMVEDNEVLSFDIVTGLTGPSLTLPRPPPSSPSSNWALSCTRWGPDGMAILDDDGKLYILRWSEIGRAGSDEDDDGVPDSWENLHFSGLGADLEADGDGDGIPGAIEYFFGTSPSSPSGNPLKSWITGLPGAAALVLEFPRRNGLANSYRIQTSTDLLQWTETTSVVETIIASEVREGVPLELVRAEVAMPEGSRFARIKWRDP